MTTIVSATVAFQRGTSATAAANNKTLVEGVPGWETDTGKFKIGDGATPWNSLPYHSFWTTWARVESKPTTVAGYGITDAAPLASPPFTGTPTAPTAAPGTNNTQIATTAFVAALVSLATTGLLDLKGDIDCSANPNYPAASKGDAYIVSVAGKIGGGSGISVDVGDTVIAKADNAGGTQASVGSSWWAQEHNLAGALLAANNLSDLASAAAARTNLGLGTMATEAATLYALLTGATFSGLMSADGVRATGVSSAASGSGMEMLWNGTIGTVAVINRATSAALPLQIFASTVKFTFLPPNYANDTAAAAGGVGLNEIYRNGSQLMIRVM